MSEIEKKWIDHYGYVNYELVGVVDYNLLIKNNSRINYQKWENKYHPKKYFSAMFWRKAKDNELSLLVKSSGLESSLIELYVPIDDINLNWDTTHYFQRTNSRQKKLPIVHTRKQVDKWKNQMEKIYEQCKK